MNLAGWLAGLAVTTAIGLGVMILGIALVSPQDIGPVGVTIWFVIGLVAIGSGMTLAFYGAKSYLRSHQSAYVRLRYSLRQGYLVSAFIIGVLALSSLKQLGWLDAILLGLLLIIIEAYARFRWP